MSEIKLANDIVKKAIIEEIGELKDRLLKERYFPEKGSAVVGSVNIDRKSEELRLGQEGDLEREGYSVGAGYIEKEINIDEIIESQDRGRKMEVETSDRDKEGENSMTEKYKPEDIERAELNKVINDFWSKQSQIAKMRAQKTSRWTLLRKVLGLEVQNLEDDEEIKNLESESQNLYRDLLAKGIKLYKSDKTQLENFLRRFDEFEVFRLIRNEELDERAKIAGFPENVLAGLQTLTKKWNELNWRQKIAISAGGGLLFGGGALALGVGTLGAAIISAGWRWGFRTFGAAAAGVGRNVMLDRQMMSEMEKGVEMRLKERLSILENSLDQGIENILSKAGIDYVRKDFERRRIDNELRALKFARNTFVISSVLGESFGYASRAAGINLGSIFKKIGEYAGVGSGNIGLKMTPEQTADADLGIPKETRISPDYLEKFNKSIESAKVSGVQAEDMYPGEKYGPARYGTEGEGHLAEVEGTEVKDTKPKLEEIASGKIGRGGSLWGSIEKSIRTSPEAYGLDPKDPDFTKEMHRMTKQMLDEFASRKGLTYSQLDQIARTKVQPGDTLKIIYNPETEEFHLEYEGKAFGADITGEISAEEAPSDKASAVPEGIKTKTGGTEYVTQESISRGKSVAEIEADYQQDLAEKKYARAVQAEKDLARLHERQSVYLEKASYEATLRQGMAIRGLLKNVIQEAGIGNNVSLWEEPASKWYDEFIKSEKLISQDVSQSNGIDSINKNREILKRVFSQLPKPQVGETTWQALLRALSEDPNNLIKINKALGRG